MKHLVFSFLMFISIHLGMNLSVSAYELCPARALEFLEVVDEILKDIDFEILGMEEDASEMISKLSRNEIDSILVCNGFAMKLKLRKSLPISKVRFAVVGRSSGMIGTLHGFENPAIVKFSLKNVRFYGDIAHMRNAFSRGEIEGILLPKTAFEDIEDSFEELDEWSTCVLVFSERVPNEIVRKINSAILKAYSRFENPPNEITLQVLDHPPHGFMEKGVWTGPDVEKVEKIFSKLNYKVKFVSYPRSRSFEYLKMGLIDGVFLVERSPNLEKFLEFIDSPLRSGSDVIFTVKDLKDRFKPMGSMFKSCGFVKGYSHEDLIGDFCEKLFKIKDVETGLKLLRVGRIDALITNYSYGSFQVEKLDLKEVVHSSAIRNYNYYLALSKSSPHIALVPFIEMELKKLENVGR